MTQQIELLWSHIDMTYVPRAYPKPSLTAPLIVLAIVFIFWLVNPLAGLIFAAIAAVCLTYSLLCYVIDFAGAWADHKWGYKLWLEDAMDTPCTLHLYSTQDPACPYLHADQEDNTV